MSLVARVLEAAGICTVIIGAAKDIVEHCGVARYLYSDFPLGNPCGAPYDQEMQKAILLQAFDLLQASTEARTTWQTPFRWDNEGWKLNFMNIDNLESLKAAGEERRRQQVQSQS